MINTCVYKYRTYPCKMRLIILKKIDFKYGSYNMACEMVSGFNTSPTSRKHIFSNQWGQGNSNDVSRCALDSLRSIVLRRCNHDSMKV